jgi:outer membrane protein TolC
LDIARRTTNSYGGSLTVFSQRLGGGVASKLETDRAEGALADVAATVPDLEQRIRLQENQTQRPARPRLRLHSARRALDRPNRPARRARRAARHALLERRPDIRQAEQHAPLRQRPGRRDDGRIFCQK